MTSWDEFVSTSIGYAVAASVALAAIVAIRLSGGWGRLVLMPRLRPGRWGGPAVLGHYLIYRVAPFVAIALFAQLGLYRRLLPENLDMRRDVLRYANLAIPLAYCGFLAISFNLISRVSQTPISKVGLGLTRWRPHVVLGAAAFLIGTPIILGVNVLTEAILGAPDWVLGQLKQDDVSTLEWSAFFLQAVVFAPIVEEWIFRGLLQGWLRRTNLLGHAVVLWTTVLFAAVDDRDQMTKVFFAAGFGILYACLVGVLYWPVMTRGVGVFMVDQGPLISNPPDFWTTNLFEAEGRENRVAPWCDFGRGWARWKNANARLAVFGSSLAFATLHGWPSCIPLLLFGFVAGWMAYRTQSLVPGIVLHVLFNLAAFVALVSLPVS